MKTKIGISSMLLLIIGMSLIGVGAVSATGANATDASYVISHGVIGKDVPPIGVGTVSAAQATGGGSYVTANGVIGKNASYVISHGVIGKDVPIIPSVSIDAPLTAYYYAYAQNYNTGNWMSLTSYNYNGYASCSAGPGTALSCSGA